jgi:type I restriction enzyme S subunit
MYGATAGKTAISKIPLTTNQACCNMTINPNIADYRYIYYYLCFKYSELASLANGGAQQNLNAQIIKDFDISLPSLYEQDRISSILSSIDDKIEINRRINENLEQQAQALFKSWFVDFEPFKDLPFVESELGMIPQGWKVGSFIDLINVMPGGTPSTGVSEYWDNATIPFFSPKDANGVYCFDTEKHISEIGLSTCSSHLYPKDTLFITARGTVGKITLAGVPMAMNQSNYALVSKDGVGKFYLYLLTQTIVSILLKKANGAVFSAITTKDFNEIIVCPTFEIISDFEKLVKPMFDKIHILMDESRRLAELRDTLLPRLMSGEINLKVADEQ